MTPCKRQQPPQRILKVKDQGEKGKRGLLGGGGGGWGKGHTCLKH